jgi:hypothetical protein
MSNRMQHPKVKININVVIIIYTHTGLHGMIIENTFSIKIVVFSNVVDFSQTTQRHNQKQGVIYSKFSEKVKFHDL